MAPLAWKLLEEGEVVHAVLSAGYDRAGDHRLALLEGYDSFRLHEVRPVAGRRLAALAGWWRETVPYALWFLRRHGVALVAVDWGYGLPAGFERLRSMRGVAAVLRSVIGSLRLRGHDRQQPATRPRASFVAAARALRVPTVCLPHGLNVKRDAVNDQMLELIAAGRLDWRDRNRFAVYVLNTAAQRDMHLEQAGGDPAVMQTWGSLRWDPRWFELNRHLAPDLAWPEPADGRVRVLFMVPKWGNRVDLPATLELFRRLHAMPDVSLAIMGHPRLGRGDADPLRADPAIDWSRVHDLTGRNSVSAIAASDVVIDAGSSIGVEVVMQERVLVNPTYLHEQTTLFDTVEGCCVVAHGPQDVTRYLEAHAAGAAHRVAPAARDELLRTAVFASEAAPFDVIGRYHERITALAANGGKR